MEEAAPHNVNVKQEESNQTVFSCWECNLRYRDEGPGRIHGRSAENNTGVVNSTGKYGLSLPALQTPVYG
ncbi:hypothetical protein WMY93_009289 [Mugilogobius chulae]|uniref:Uncharacterized protein n=1 Tax=Mugilogobius chulae TaxID=88201 RepID=A0AAW0PM48_9GOBI